MNDKTRKFITNIIYAFTAQGISLLLSILMSLTIPKLLGVEEYSYWQLFLFYSGYTAFFHFGLNDGMYLRLGGKDYKDVNHSLLGTQLKLITIIQILIAVIISIIGLIIVDNKSRQFVIFAICIYLVTYNISGYIGYIFQAVNRTRIYSISVMIDKMIFIIAVIILLLLKIERFEFFVLLYLFSKLIALGYCIWMGKALLFSKIVKIKEAIKEMWTNMTVGIKLLIANIASSLILGSGRIVIDAIWGIEEFGKFSFSLSLTNFFLLFISQISMVIFPALRQTNKQLQKKVYLMASNVLSLVLPGIFLAYMPMSYLIGLWLPQYKESLQYLALLLPICTFDGKMQMLCNTYLKVLRKEKVLLTINIISMLIAFIMCLFGGYVMYSIYGIVVFMVIAVTIRSIISEIYLSKLMETNIISSLIFEVILATLFMITTWYLNHIVSFFIYSIFYFNYLLINRDKIKKIIIFSRRITKKD